MDSSVLKRAALESSIVLVPTYAAAYLTEQTVWGCTDARGCVDIDIAGYDIDPPSRNGIPIRNGRYNTGLRGSDYIEGNFHGLAHRETYGVFDTGAYVGAFGAERTP